MSKAAWTTLGLSCAFTGSLIYLVHRQQRVEKQVNKQQNSCSFFDY